MATPQEIRDMSDQDVAEHIKNTRRDMFGLRFQHATGELENTAGLRNAKRSLARALTIARQRGIDPDQKSTS